MTAADKADTLPAFFHVFRGAIDANQGMVATKRLITQLSTKQSRFPAFRIGSIGGPTAKIQVFQDKAVQPPRAAFDLPVDHGKSLRQVWPA